VRARWPSASASVARRSGTRTSSGNDATFSPWSWRASSAQPLILPCGLTDALRQLHHAVVGVLHHHPLGIEVVPLLLSQSLEIEVVGAGVQGLGVSKDELRRAEELRSRPG